MSGWQDQAAITQALQELLPAARRVLPQARHGLVADEPYKYRICNRYGIPVGFALVSAPADARLVETGIAKSGEARARLNGRARLAILEPLSAGRIGELSYGIWPYRWPVNASRPSRMAFKLLFSEAVLEWLSDVAAQTSHPVPPGELQEAFFLPLQALCSSCGIPHRARQLAEQGLDRLAGALWRPRFILSHNDLWVGNLLWGLPLAPAIAVVDWAGSLVKGYAFLDLTMLMASLGRSASEGRYAEQMQRHMSLLGCASIDAASYVLAGLGRIRSMPGHFPESGFMALVADCTGRLDRWLCRSS